LGKEVKLKAWSEPSSFLLMLERRNEIQKTFVECKVSSACEATNKRCDPIQNHKDGCHSSATEVYSIVKNEGEDESKNKRKKKVHAL